MKPGDFKIGDAVVYVDHSGKREDGMVTSVNDSFVFVKFKHQHPNANGKACLAKSLEKL